MDPGSNLRGTRKTSLAEAKTTRCARIGDPPRSMVKSWRASNWTGPFSTDKTNIQKNKRNESKICLTFKLAKQTSKDATSQKMLCYINKPVKHPSTKQCNLKYEQQAQVGKHSIQYLLDQP